MFGRHRAPSRSRKARGFAERTPTPGFVFVGGGAWDEAEPDYDDQGVPGAWSTQGQTQPQGRGNSASP